MRAHRTRAPDTPAETTVSPQTGLQRSIGFFPLNGELSGRAVVWMDMYVAHTHTPYTHTPYTHTHPLLPLSAATQNGCTRVTELSALRLLKGKFTFLFFG